MIKRTVLFLLGLILLLPGLSCADFTAQLRADFKTVSGVVVMPVGEEYLIDLDASMGVMTGDLFSVVVPGEPVLHPVTGKQLGTLDQVKGYLQVTEVRSGYSHARALGEESSFAKGDIIQRYSNVKAAFWDYSDAEQGLFTKLRAALPTLVWQNYAEAQAQRPEAPKLTAGLETPLLFIYQNGALEVRGAAFQILHRYVVTEQEQTVSVANAIVTPHNGTIPQGGIVKSENKNWQGVRTVEELIGDVVGLEVADFDGDGQNETAVLDRKGVTLYRFTLTGHQQLARIDLTHADKYLTLDRADLDGDGRPELCITAVTAMKPASLVLKYAAGEWSVSQQDIAYFLRAVDLPGEGRVLLGQPGGGSLEDFGHGIYRMQLKKDILTRGAAYPVPWKIKLFGFTPFMTSDGKILHADLATNNRVRVLQDDADELWKSSQVYGGSRNSFERPDFSGGAGDSVHDVILKPRLETDSSEVILVPSNAGRSFIAQMADLGPGSIYAMKWDGSAMNEVWHTQPQSGYLADFRFADIDNDGLKELALLMVVSKEGVSNSGRSSLVVYELQ